MSKLKLAGVAAALTFLSAGNAFAETRTFDFGPFDKIEARRGINIEIARSETQSVEVDAADPDEFDHLEIEVQGNTLAVGSDYGLADFIWDGGLLGGLFRDGPKLDVRVAIPALSEVSASSGADAHVTGFDGQTFGASSSSGADLALEAMTFETIALNASSGSDIVVSGTCTTVSAEVSSGADIDASGLECEDGSAAASSGGASIFARPGN